MTVDTGNALQFVCIVVLSLHSLSLNPKIDIGQVILHVLASIEKVMVTVSYIIEWRQTEQSCTVV